MQTIDTVIFDKSGVLIDDFDAVMHAVKEVCLNHGINPPSSAQYRKDSVLGFREAWNKWGFSHISLSNIAGELAQSWSPDVPQHLKEGARETLRYLQETNCGIYLVSSHPHALLIEELDKFGIFDFFTQVIGSALDKTPVIRKLLTEFSLNPSRTAYIGDMTTDIRHARKAGVISVACFGGYHEREHLLNENPDIAVDGVYDLITHLHNAA